MRVSLACLALLGAFPARVSAQQTSPGAGPACALLLADLGPSLVVSTGPVYDSGAGGSWNELNNDYRPTCIVFAETTLHVQRAMTIIFTQDVRYSVQSGGHAGVEGWNK